MQDDLISVIIPAYNCEEYIDQCIESVFSQTYQNFEIIVIDDGSTDKTGALLDLYVNDKVRVIHNENHGLSYSRQCGIDNSNGKYLVTIDSDDYLMPKYLEELHKSIVDNDADVSICERYDFLDEKAKVVCLNNETQTLSTNQDLILDNMFSIGKLCELSDSWNKMYSVAFLKKANVVFNLPKQYNGNDLSFNYRLLLHCPKYSFVNEPLLMHRLTPGSMVRSKDRPIQEGFNHIISLILNDIRDQCYPDRIFNQVSELYSNLLFLSFIYYANGHCVMKHMRTLLTLNKTFLDLTPSISVVNGFVSNGYEKAVLNSIRKNNFMSLVLLSVRIRFSRFIKKLLNKI